MTRIRLRNILGGVLASSLPLALAGCPPGGCPPYAENIYVGIPDGGLVAPDNNGGTGGDGGAYLSENQCIQACNWNRDYLLKDQPHVCRLTQTDGGVRIYCQAFLRLNCVGGRRPEGVAPFADAGAGDVLGRFFARQAQLEAASVPAFARLRAELVAHGAPKRLARACDRARSDEKRHARLMTALARRHGADPVPPRVEAGPVRSLEAVATENAIEGCVRESYGALSVMWQARRGNNLAIAQTMRRIAVDETRHALLSWAIDGWARGRLSLAARRRVEEAKRAALSDLRAELACEVPSDLVLVAGVPRREESMGFLDGIEASLDT